MSHEDERIEELEDALDATRAQLDAALALAERRAGVITILRQGIRKATAMTHGHLGTVPYSEPSYNAKYMHKILAGVIADADSLSAAPPPASEGDGEGTR